MLIQIVVWSVQEEEEEEEVSLHSLNSNLLLEPAESHFLCLPQLILLLVPLWGEGAQGDLFSLQCETLGSWG